MSLAASFRCVLKLVLDGFRFLDFFWWLVGPRMNWAPTALVQNAHHWNQLHTTTSGQQMLQRAATVTGSQQTSLKTNLQETIFSRARKELTFILERIYHHWNQFHKTTSGQQILPRATAPMGNMMGPGANTNTTRLGTQA